MDRGATQTVASCARAIVLVYVADRPTHRPEVLGSLFPAMQQLLLYSSGVGMSWCGFRFNLRPIRLLAIGCVLFTATAVAALGHLLLGGSNRTRLYAVGAVGFVLGVVVAPPMP